MPVAVAFVAVLAGCGGDDPTEEDVKQLLEWAAVSHAQGSLLHLIYDGGTAEDSDDPVVAAERIATAASAKVVADLGACATATRDGATVAYAFDGCAGPFELEGLTGRIDATYSVEYSPGGGYNFGVIRVHAQSQGAITFKGASLTLTLDGGNTISRSYWSASGTPPEARFNIWVSAASSGTSGLLTPGISIETVPSPPLHDTTPVAGALLGGELSGVFDSNCGELAGPGSVRGRSDAFSGTFKRCGHGCPASSASSPLTYVIQIFGDRGAINAGVQFDGSATASIGIDGEWTPVELSCTP